MSNTQDSSHPIVWIDCEMTGIDPNIDEIIEIAVIVTDREINSLDVGIDLLIKPSQKALENMNDFVTEMHTKSGLLAELDNGISLEQAKSEVLAYIKSLVPEAKVALLGGNSVGTDKTFLQTYMPEVVEHIHYRIIDVSTLKELARFWYPKLFFAAPKKTGGHRALGDIQDSINELRYYRQAMMVAPPGPDRHTCEEMASRLLAEHKMVCKDSVQ